MGSTRTRKSMNNQKSDSSISVYVDPVDDAMELLCKDYYESGVCKGSPVYQSNVFGGRDLGNVSFIHL